MKIRSLLVSAVFISSFIAASGATLFNPGTASANSGCDDVNIIHCGIGGSSLSGQINSFQKIVKENDNNGHSDLDTVFDWAGASESDLKNMDTGNTELGTLHRNGEVTVGGDVVATNAWVAARFTEGSGFTKVSDGVWARKTTTSFANSTERSLVHFNGHDEVDWVVLVNCGNAVKVTPVKKEVKKEVEKKVIVKKEVVVVQPVAEKKALNCVSLTANAVNSQNRVFNFAATASAENTGIVSYDFDFGDGATFNVASNSTSASAEHTFANGGKTFTARVSVNGQNLQGVSSNTCVVNVTTEQPPQALPNTGAAGLLGVFTGTSAIGALGHRWFTTRRRP